MPETAGSTQQELSHASVAVKTLKEIAEELGVAYGRLRGFADTPGIQDFVGAERVPGAKGVRYPPQAVDQFRALIAAQDQGLVTPKTAAAWLKNQKSEPATDADIAAMPQYGNGTAAAGPAAAGLVPVATADAQSAFALMQQYGNGSELPPAVSQMVGAMQDLAQALRQNTPPEQYYTLKRAAEATGLSQNAIRRGVPFVQDGSRHKYAASDLKAFQDRLQRHEPRPPQKRLPPAAETADEQQPLS